MKALLRFNFRWDYTGEAPKHHPNVPIPKAKGGRVQKIRIPQTITRKLSLINLPIRMYSKLEDIDLLHNHNTVHIIIKFVKTVKFVPFILSQKAKNFPSKKKHLKKYGGE